MAEYQHGTRHTRKGVVTSGPRCWGCVAGLLTSSRLSEVENSTRKEGLGCKPQGRLQGGRPLKDSTRFRDSSICLEPSLGFPLSARSTVTQ